MKLFKYLLTSLLVLTAACSTGVKKEEFAPVFYPEPPAEPRIHYLTSFTGAEDIEPEKSAFDRFITGQKEPVRRLDKPYGVAMRNGRIYVCDTNRSNVMVFDLEKMKFSPLRGSQGLGKLVQPINISIDNEENKFVSDPIRGQVVMFDKNDSYVRSFGMPGNWKPVDAVRFEDRLYVADPKNSEIKVFDIKTGEVVSRIGQSGEDKDKLVLPTNLAFDREGYLYISDSGRFQLVKFDRDGHMRGTIGRLGSSPGEFSRPRGVAIDRDEHIFAVDAAFDNVQIFNKEGWLMMSFAKAGSKPGDLFLPAKVSIDYSSVNLFRKYADPAFEIEYLILVTSQFGNSMVNVYGFGKEKGRKYPTDEDLRKELNEVRQKWLKDHPEEKAENAASAEGQKK